MIVELLFPSTSVATAPLGFSEASTCCSLAPAWIPQARSAVVEMGELTEISEHSFFSHGMNAHSSLTDERTDIVEHSLFLYIREISCDSVRKKVHLR